MPIEGAATDSSLFKESLNNSLNDSLEEEGDLNNFFEEVEKVDRSEEFPTSLLGGCAGNALHNEPFSDRSLPRIDEQDGIDPSAWLSGDLGGDYEH